MSIWKRKRHSMDKPCGVERKRRKDDTCSSVGRDDCGFPWLPVEMLLTILIFVATTADSTSDVVKLALVCTSFGLLALEKSVLKELSVNGIADATRRWLQGSDDAALLFLRRCADSGNMQSCYFLGTVLFYCKRETDEGLDLIKRAAEAGDAEAWCTLTIIHFNGSGSPKVSRDLATGIFHCKKAASLGSMQAMRELGHCLIDGYGIERNPCEGSSYLSKSGISQYLEQTVAVAAAEPRIKWKEIVPKLPPPHPINRILAEWETTREDGALRLCGNRLCNRPQTRPSEFRWCAGCFQEQYCSRTCQETDWLLHHRPHSQKFGLKQI